jgi:hypothetical protein
MLPETVGSKLIDNEQEAPAASVPTVEERALIIGQAVAPVLSRVKLVAMLGLLPVEGTGKLSGILPMFRSITAFGLSLLVVPTCVGTKLRLGGSAKSAFHTLPPAALDVKTLPLPSTATPMGSYIPLAIVLWV